MIRCGPCSTGRCFDHHEDEGCLCYCTRRCAACKHVELRNGVYGPCDRLIPMRGRTGTCGCKDPIHTGPAPEPPTSGSRMHDLDDHFDNFEKMQAERGLLDDAIDRMEARARETARKVAERPAVPHVSGKHKERAKGQSEHRGKKRAGWVLVGGGCPCCGADAYRAGSKQYGCDWCRRSCRGGQHVQAL